MYKHAPAHAHTHNNILCLQAGKPDTSHLRAALKIACDDVRERKQTTTSSAPGVRAVMCLGRSGQHVRAVLSFPVHAPVAMAVAPTAAFAAARTRSSKGRSHRHQGVHLKGTRW
eukprot:6182922-Pleurochrysis_carterae.AAC.1